uniref:Uncharacterized protein n=1 Tax=Mustela putorius furo TaxID=9669 RepID=M3YN10_MUSPF
MGQVQPRGEATPRGMFKGPRSSSSCVSPAPPQATPLSSPPTHPRTHCPPGLLVIQQVSQPGPSFQCLSATGRGGDPEPTCG